MKARRRGTGESLDEVSIHSSKSWMAKIRPMRRTSEPVSNKDEVEQEYEYCDDTASSTVYSEGSLYTQSPTSDSQRVHSVSTEWSRKDAVVSFVSLASRVLVEVGEATNIPYLKGIAGLVRLIIECTDVSVTRR